MVFIQNNMKEFSEKELESKSGDVFKAYPDTTKCFGTTDGQMFPEHNERFAREHARTKGVKLIEIKKGSKVEKKKAPSKKKESTK